MEELQVVSSRGFEFQEMQVGVPVRVAGREGGGERGRGLQVQICVTVHLVIWGICTCHGSLSHLGNLYLSRLT